MPELSMADDIETVLTGVKRMHLTNIYSKVRKLRRQSGRSTPATLEEAIRNTLQRCCADCPQFNGDDRFEQTDRGVWCNK